MLCSETGKVLISGNHSAVLLVYDSLTVVNHIDKFL
jgi:hypothetical protein